MKIFVNTYKKSHGNYKLIGIIFIILILMSLFVSFCVKREPDISGSGIPQVEGLVHKKLTNNWKKVLVYKFFGGIVALAAGLSVGREGPSIQMGAAIGEGISKNSNHMDHEQRYLLTSGASAGLAAAFNAPLAGVMFALEEVHKNFSPIVLLSAMVSAVTADMVTKAILGINKALKFPELTIMPIKYYWSLIILGIVVGLSSYVFNNGLIYTKKIYKRIPTKLEFKIMIPFLMSGIIGLMFPILLGGGHELIMDISVFKITLLMSLTLLVIKYLFTFISFGSGVPGGIFFPLLAIGSLMGNAIGIICIKYLGVPQEFLLNFAILAMAGHFAAIVKAPITGIILIFEMTGSFEQLLPLSVVVFSALITSDLLGVEPVYDMLLEGILKNKKEEIEIDKSKKTLVEVTVHMGSEIESKCIKDIVWPEKSLVVAIYRGPEEIIPRGNTKILSGDRVLMLVNKSESSMALDYLTGITTH